MNLPVGGTVTYTVHSTVREDASGSLMTNTATIRAGHTSDPNAGNNSASDTDELPFLIDAHFDADADGFTYADLVFRNADEPDYADGSYLPTGGFSGGGIKVQVGNFNSRNRPNMAGAWQKNFSLSGPTPLTLSFRYIINTQQIDADEYTEMLVSIDGVLKGVAPNDYVARLSGNSGTNTSGWQQVTFDLGTMPAGTHLLSMGAFLNKKSGTSELGAVILDDIKLIAGVVPGGPGDVPVAPSIITPPASVTVTEPASAAFAVVVAGEAPFTYQWRRNGVAIAGANSTSYVLNPTVASVDNGAQFDVVVSNVAGSVTSVAATLTVNPAPVAPSITTHPASMTVTEPASATFSVVATGDAPLSYQWRRNGVAMGGATSSSYVVSPTNMADNGAQFDVIVSNAAGTLTSAPGTLTVLPTPVPPSITSQPANVTVTAPAAANFSVVATGDAPLAYQWRRNGIAIGGATSSSYSLNPTAVSDSGATFDVVVTNGAGTATSAVATLTVNAANVPPSITTQPASTTVTAPGAATFSVVATGTAPLSYQWRRNGVNIAGATSATYVKTPTAHPADNGSTYTVVVTNVAGTVTSAGAVLTVDPPPVAPSITTQPASSTVTMPAAATFSVVATGTAPLSYQWRRNGVDIGGATGTSYVLSPTAASDSGATFDVVVTNAAGTATSSAATLTVLTGVSSVVFEAHFEGGSDGFAYADDQFGTIQPLYASGGLVGGGGFTGDGAQVLLGGINGSNVANISGGWNRSFALAGAAPATVTFRYKLTGTGLDSGELGRMLVSINGVLKGVSPNTYVAQVGGTGLDMTTNWQQVTLNLGTLPAGNHVLALGGFLTRKTGVTETAQIVIDDVLLTVEQ